jgi:hypothetical protein
MKKITLPAIAMLLLCLVYSGINAQCTSCTTTITTTDPSNHLITAGTTLCIAAGGTCTGLIQISGGTLCNQGTISNHNLEVQGSGSTLNNYGTINSDSLLVIGSGAVFNNYNTLTDSRLAVSSQGVINNLGGTITCAYFGDTIATLLNNGNMTITADFSSGYSATVTNNNYMKVGHNFYNGYSSIFYTACMITVQGTWYNSATITGPTGSGCGGFSITSGSYNSGGIGGTGQHVDICDATHPSGGITGNTGTMTTGVTFCVCTNACPMVTAGIFTPSASGPALLKNIYPNPATTEITLGINSDNPTDLQITIYNVLGKTCMHKQYASSGGEQLLPFDIAALEPGIYLLAVSNSKGAREVRTFEVSK